MASRHLERCRLQHQEPATRLDAMGLKQGQASSGGQVAAQVFLSAESGRQCADRALHSGGAPQASSASNETEPCCQVSGSLAFHSTHRTSPTSITARNESGAPPCGTTAGQLHQSRYHLCHEEGLAHFLMTRISPHCCRLRRCLEEQSCHRPALGIKAVQDTRSVVTPDTMCLEQSFREA